MLSFRGKELIVWGMFDKLSQGDWNAESGEIPMAENGEEVSWSVSGRDARCLPISTQKFRTVSRSRLSSSPVAKKISISSFEWRAPRKFLD
jgi:hypothetical protein